MRRDLDTAGFYLIAFLPVAMLAIAFSFAALALASLLLPRFTPEWLGVVLNVLPAAAAGLIAYSVLAHRRAIRGRWTHHIVRTSPLYLLAFVLGALTAYGFAHPSSGFGLVGQLVVWPLAAAIGGMLGDAAVAVRGPRIGKPEQDG